MKPARGAKGDRAAELTAQFARAPDARGIRCDVLTEGWTGTAGFDAESGVYMEGQPGSYIFMDGPHRSGRRCFTCC
jgi:D-serine deaminase-like pyridoxal phosphate-dependent protein